MQVVEVDSQVVLSLPALICGACLIFEIGNASAASNERRRQRIDSARHAAALDLARRQIRPGSREYLRPGTTTAVRASFFASATIVERRPFSSARSSAIAAASGALARIRHPARIALTIPLAAMITSTRGTRQENRAATAGTRRKDGGPAGDHDRERVENAVLHCQRVESQCERNRPGPGFLRVFICPPYLVRETTSKAPSA